MNHILTIKSPIHTYQWPTNVWQWLRMCCHAGSWPGDHQNLALTSVLLRFQPGVSDGFSPRQLWKRWKTLRLPPLKALVRFGGQNLSTLVDWSSMPVDPWLSLPENPTDPKPVVHHHQELPQERSINKLGVLQVAPNSAGSSRLQIEKTS